MVGLLLDSIVGAVVGMVLEAVYNWFKNNHEYISIHKSLIFKRNKSVRISYAYLFRVKIQNKYLLIKGSRIDQYQPIGGVYKYFASFKDKKEKWEIEDEKDSSFYEQGDLRIFIKGKYVVPFLEWIKTSENRECDHIREFYEELVSPGYIKEECLKSISFEYIKRVNSGVHYSVHQQSDEILVFDIIDVLGIDDTLSQFIMKTVDSHDELALVSSEEIDRQCFEKNGLSTKIGEHCQYIK